ncbi:urease accessory protein [Aminobacter aminovorans]|jgi:urease accessory protein|uniref:Urease accessory protein UreD n=1 Tax=Aminobacter aminovorans TaxID=83263 RepID=A0A380WDR9_AMIAI|nr:urease accessory protein UreD [Aminobacter aminovorans]TCS25513.1 urease accessory protein [Aminobacter aminovorans]SUU87163.1 Urease accessory protein UreD [Aminobacter aminovorans]
MTSGISSSVQADAAAISTQRVAARGRIEIDHRAGRSRLARLYQDGAAKIRLPETGADPLEAVLINMAGGLTGGDRLGWEVSVGASARAVITTQACEKVYRALTDRAEVEVRLSVGAGGYLGWLPQETITYDRSAFSRRLDADLAVGAEALIVEATVFGRSAMGERVESGTFRDRWRVRSAGRLIHAEDFSVGPEIEATLGRKASSGGRIAMATLLLVSERSEHLLEPARQIVGDDGGASFWSVGPTGKLLARLYAGDGYTLRKRLMPLVALLNGQAGLPRLWSL